jgi:hypothetical protein
VTEQAKETWEDYCRRTSGPNWAIRTEFSLLHGRAFRSLKRITTTKALFYFYEKRVVKVDKRKRGEKRFQVQHDAEIKFSYKEAEQRGLTRKRFAQAIRDLHAAGFIDILYRGSGALKDSSTYRLSERWRRFDMPDFKPQDIPKRLREDSTKNLEHDEKGRWTRKEEKLQVVISTLDQGSKRPLEITAQGPNRPLEMGDFDQSSRVKVSTELSTTRRCTTSEEGVEKILTLNPRSKSTAAAKKRDDEPSKKAWRPPLSKIRENVAEILRQRPDPRADDPQFVRLISGQLGEALAGRLDPGRVHRDFQAKHGFNDWTTDLFFAVATINLDFTGRSV